MDSEQTVLEKLHKNGITATDIATQFWCERQMELNNLYKPTPTKAMEKGARMHEAWQAKAYVPLSVETRSYPDFLYKIAYENYMTLKRLKEGKEGRELMVYGSVNGYRLSGKIDELKIRDGKTVIVEDKTVKEGMTIDNAHTKPHIVQIMLYRKMLDDIRCRSYSYDNFANVYRLSKAKLSEEFLKGLGEINLKGKYLSLESMYRKMFEEMHAMPELCDDLELRYVDRRSGTVAAELKVRYDRDMLAGDLSYAMQYWRGERESTPVAGQERWKCNSCKFFGKKCMVWWTGG